MRSIRRSHPAAGFTVIELLVVIAIISVLTALVLPAAQKVRGVIAQDTSPNLEPLKRQVLAHGVEHMDGITRIQAELGRGILVGRDVVQVLFDLACSNARTADGLLATTVSHLPGESDAERMTLEEIVAFLEISQEVGRKAAQALAFLLHPAFPPQCVMEAEPRG